MKSSVSVNQVCCDAASDKLLCPIDTYIVMQCIIVVNTFCDKNFQKVSLDVNPMLKTRAVRIPSCAGGMHCTSHNHHMQYGSGILLFQMPSSGL